MHSHPETVTNKFASSRELAIENSPWGWVFFCPRDSTKDHRARTFPQEYFIQTQCYWLALLCSLFLSLAFIQYFVPTFSFCSWFSQSIGCPSWNCLCYMSALPELMPYFPFFCSVALDSIRSYHDIVSAMISFCWLPFLSVCAGTWFHHLIMIRMMPCWPVFISALHRFY